MYLQVQNWLYCIKNCTLLYIVIIGTSWWTFVVFPCKLQYVKMYVSEWQNFLLIFRPNIYVLNIHCLHKPIIYFIKATIIDISSPSAPLAYPLLEICPKGTPPRPTPPPLQYVFSSFLLDFQTIPVRHFEVSHIPPCKLLFPFYLYLSDNRTRRQLVLIHIYITVKNSVTSKHTDTHIFRICVHSRIPYSIIWLRCSDFLFHLHLYIADESRIRHLHTYTSYMCVRLLYPSLACLSCSLPKLDYLLYMYCIYLNVTCGIPYANTCGIPRNSW